MLKNFQDREKKEWFHTDIETIKKTIKISQIFLDNFLPFNLNFSNNLELLETFLNPYYIETKLDNIINNDNNLENIENQKTIDEKSTNNNDEICENIELFDDKKSKNNIGENFTLIKQFINECTIQCDFYTAKTLDITGFFRHWNRRMTTEDRSLLKKYLLANYKEFHNGIFNKDRLCKEVAYSGLKLKDITYNPQNANNLNDFDKFIINKCNISYSGRVSVFDITKEYIKWKNDNNIPIIDEKNEIILLKKHLNDHFVYNSGKFIFKRKIR